MRLHHMLCSVGLLALPLLPASAQDAPVRIHADVGVGAIRAQEPYRTGPVAAARVGVGFRLSPSLALAVDGHLLGSGTSADAYGAVSRPLPNTIGVSASLVPMFGPQHRVALDVGGGVYSVAARPIAPGGRTFGVHVGSSAMLGQWAHLAATLGIRALLLTDVHGARILTVPLSVGVTSR